MDSSAFRIRGETCDRVTKAVSTLTLHKNERGGYAYDDARIFEKQVERELERQHCEHDDGMKGLLSEQPNNINGLRSNKVATRSSILAASKAAAAKATREATGETKIAPEIVTNDDARDEADRVNMFRLAVIGAKEGVAAGIRAVVGNDITDNTLRTTDGQDFRTVDEFQLCDLMTAVIEGAERPATQDVRDMYVRLCGTRFDFRTKMVTNVERFRSQAAKANAYGITVGEDVVCLVLLSNVEWAAQQEWGGEFRDAMRKIRAEYPYNKVHSATTFTAIMKRLAAADEARDLRKAKSPSGMANAVEEGLNYLGALVSQNEETSTYGEAYAATSDSESSYEKSVRSRRSRKKERRPPRRRSPSRSPSRSTSRSPSRSPSPPRRGRTPRRSAKSKSDEKSTKVKCRHCKRAGRTTPHPRVPESKCNWNKKFQGWRPEWVCSKMKIRYKPRDDFDEDGNLLSDAS